jgi:hypothetical protein
MRRRRWGVRESDFLVCEFCLRIVRSYVLAYGVEWGGERLRVESVKFNRREGIFEQDNNYWKNERRREILRARARTKLRPVYMLIMFEANKSDEWGVKRLRVESKSFLVYEFRLWIRDHTFYRVLFFCEEQFMKSREAASVLSVESIKFKRHEGIFEQDNNYWKMRGRRERFCERARLISWDLFIWLCIRDSTFERVLLLARSEPVSFWYTNFIASRV